MEAAKISVSGRLLTLGLLLAAVLPHAQADETPRSALQKAMERRFVRAATMIQAQQITELGGGTLQLKVEINTKGHQRSTVLKPLSFQGVISFDDRRQWITLLPDERKAMVQPSPTSFRAPVRERMGLVDRNYELSFERGAEVANRKTLVILARPRAQEMPRRRFFVDEETFLVLRIEVMPRTNEVERLLDTMKIEFEPGNGRRNLAPDLQGFQIERMEPPKSASPERIRAAVGFTPRKLTNLPAGFVLTDLQLVGEKELVMVAYRLTDGLSNVTVYQFSPPKRGEGGPRPMPGGTVASDGTRILVVGDAPSTVRRLIQEIFVQPAQNRP